MGFPQGFCICGLFEREGFSVTKGTRPLIAGLLTIDLNHKASSQTTKEQVQQLLKTIGAAGQTELKLKDVLRKVLEPFSEI